MNALLAIVLLLASAVDGSDGAEVQSRPALDPYADRSNTNRSSTNGRRYMNMDRKAQTVGAVEKELFRNNAMPVVRLPFCL